MPVWIPERVWDNQDVFIIGGGTSLERFDWSLLKNKNTIGCNDAYKHGIDICKICIFGDIKWFELHRRDLVHYKGAVFTNANKLYKSKFPWLWVMQREASGIHKNSLGWNYNTGASAVNLAVLLGAKQIFLLGFDMHLGKNGRNNWHDNKLNKPSIEVFPKFLQGFQHIANDLKSKYSDVSISNITDDSDLNLFPKIGVKEFWKKGN